ncbi:Multiple RNA-binding domain-containing protein 1 [Coemansia sp. Benny D160-2]|nr:Multiple RNA-binding domain-containing protein 1 [Coemansia sp. Benny D160-2]
MTSRIIVKNLPKHITEERFRSHFGAKGEVTDVKLVYHKTGKFRQFGYIGYRSEEEAQTAQTYFNNSFIDTSKIVVEIAKPLGDATLPRAWSVYSKGTTLYNKVHGVEKKAGQNKKEDEASEAKGKQKNQHAIRSLYEQLVADKQNDPRFKEFLQVMAPRAKNKAWTNDDYSNWHTDELAAVRDAVAAKRKQVNDEADDEVKETSQSGDETVTDPQGTEAGGVNEEEGGSTAVSDMEWLRMHMTSKTEDDLFDSEGEDGNEETEKPKDGENTRSLNDEAKKASAIASEKERPDPVAVVATSISEILETGRLFVRNLPYLATEDELRSAFERFGPLSEVHMPISKDTKRPKGFAYILYLLPEHAVNAYKAMDHKVFHGRILHVLPGKEKPQAREAEDGIGGFKSSVKKERDAKKKALAGSDFNWNSLYLSADAVADSISERLNIDKADLLSADSNGNPAVRLALAETHIINDTKQFFEQHGILLENFGHQERSDTVILVKNIPYSVDEEELRGLFGKFGDLGRVLVPPSRTIAVIEFFEPSEARTAFRHLAYKRLKDAPIYLERAPKDIFDAPFDPSKHVKKSISSKDASAQLDEIFTASNDPAAEGKEVAQSGPKTSMAGCVLFVKNLDFDTTEDTLRQLFSGVDGLQSVVVRRKKDPKRPGKWLSMGFGFVEYNSPDAAQQAIKAFQGVEVDDHELDIKLSDRLAKVDSGTDTGAGSSTGADGKKPKSTKLVVKNIPFEATRKDIRDLVSAFGQVKSVRLPKKFNGGHRGFAFVEFLTPQEAQHVLDTMKDTHVYGRHLVIDWAEEDNSLQAIREKVGRQFAKDGGETGQSKRRKIDMGSDEDDEFGMDYDSDED